MEFKKLKSGKKIPETRPSKEQSTFTRAQNASFKGTTQFQLINPRVCPKVAFETLDHNWWHFAESALTLLTCALFQSLEGEF